MRVHIMPEGDGKNTVWVQRTLAAEKPSRGVSDVLDRELEATVERLVNEMRGEEPAPA